jgi:hypothetical protein
MKQFSTILFAAFYLLTTVGVGINFHYCLGELSHVDVMVPHSKCCCAEADAEMAVHCCDDESYFFQLDTEQQTTQGLRLIDVTVATLVTHEVSVKETLRAENLFPLFLDLPPPHGPPIWLANCSLTYYG